MRGSPCEALVVNTAGGIVGGDQLSVEIALEGAGSAVTIGSTAAEKCYRSMGAVATIDIGLVAADGACLHWLPQETILFNGARLRRSMTIDLAPSAEFLGLETIVFGRIAHGEVMTDGDLRDSWRVRRAGRPIYADETAIAAPIDTALGRKAVGDGAKVMAMLLSAGRDVEALLGPLRAALAPFAEGMPAVESGASVRDGLLLSRMLCASPERLRACTVAAVGVLRATPLPRGWA